MRVTEKQATEQMLCHMSIGGGELNMRTCAGSRCMAWRFDGSDDDHHLVEVVGFCALTELQPVLEKVMEE